MRRHVSAMIVLAAIGCGGQPPQSRETELRYLAAAVAQPLLEFSNLEVPAIENISIADGDADSYLELRLFPGQSTLHSGVRSEISIDYPHEADARVEYKWRLRIPEDFKPDTPGNRWWLMGQWHDQPDTTKGESWATVPSRSPPILLGYGFRDEKDWLGLSYGAPDCQPIEAMQISRGCWNEIRVVIQWSMTDDGHVEVYLDDMKTPKLRASGRNMHNDFRHYFKLGMYRHADINTDNTIHIDSVEVTVLE